jgi:hypothetical protein
MDLHKVTGACAPCIQACADAFHVVKLTNTALDQALPWTKSAGGRRTPPPQRRHPPPSQRTHPQQPTTDLVNPTS